VLKRLIISLLLVAAAASCDRYLAKRMDSPVVDGSRVTFRIKCPSARTVQVAGNWNNWAKGDADEGEVLVGSMEEEDGTGIWELSLELITGRYRYKYLIDEVRWELDPGNPRVVDDGRGGKANLLIMP